MSAYLDGLRAVVVDVASPDHSVRARLAGDSGLAVVLSDRDMSGHDEHSLATQVEAALSGALKGWERAKEQVATRLRGDAPPPDPNAPAVRNRQRVAEAVEGVCTEGVSSDRSVTVARVGTSRVEVGIRPRTVNYLDNTRLATAIEQAFTAATTEQMRSIGRLRKQLFGDPLEHFERI